MHRTAATTIRLTTTSTVLALASGDRQGIVGRYNRAGAFFQGNGLKTRAKFLSITAADAPIKFSYTALLKRQDGVLRIALADESRVPRTIAGGVR